MLCALIVDVLLVVATAVLVRETRAPASSGGVLAGFAQVPELVGTGFRVGKGSPIVRLLLAASAVSGLALTGIESFWQPFFANLQLGGSSDTCVFGLIVAGSFALGMAGNLLAVPVGRLLGRRYGLACAVFQCAWGVGILVLARQSHLPAAIGCYWFAYLGMAGTNSPHSALLNGELPPAQRSSMLSISSLAGYAGSLLGGMGLGYVAENFSIGGAWGVGGLLLVLSVGLYLQVDRHETRARSRDLARATDT